MTEDKTKYKSFKEAEKISLKLEGGGELLIALKVNVARTFRIEYFLNGKLLKPKPLNGKHLAYKDWAELIKSLVENRDDFQPLTIEEQPNEETNEK